MRVKPPLGSLVSWGHRRAGGLVLCTLFNEGSGDRVCDISGNGSVGVLTGMDPPTDWVPGPVGPVLDFDGTNDYITFGVCPAIAGGAQLSVAVRVRTLTDDEDHQIVTRGSSATDAEIILLHGDDVCGAGVQGAGNTDTFMFDVGATGAGGNRVNGTTGARLLNTWQTVVGVMSGVDRLLYVDGVLNASHSSGVATTLPTTVDALRFGSWQFSAVYGAMQLDWVAIWMRALAADEVADLQADPFAMFEPSPSRVVRYWWPGAAGPTTYAVSLADALAVTDTVTPAARFVVGLSDGLAATDLSTPQARFPVTLADVPALADEIALAVRRPVALADAATASDEITVLARRLVVQLADAATADDAVAIITTHLISLVDTASVADVLTLTGAITYVLALADDVAVSDRWYEGLPKALRFLAEELERRFGLEEMERRFDSEERPRRFTLEELP